MSEDVPHLASDYRESAFSGMKYMYSSNAFCWRAIPVYYSVIRRDLLKVESSQQITPGPFTALFGPRYGPVENFHPGEFSATS